MMVGWYLVETHTILNIKQTMEKSTEEQQVILTSHVPTPEEIFNSNIGGSAVVGAAIAYALWKKEGKLKI